MQMFGISDVLYDMVGDYYLVFTQQFENVSMNTFSFSDRLNLLLLIGVWHNKQINQQYIITHLIILCKQEILAFSQ